MIYLLIVIAESVSLARIKFWNRFMVFLNLLVFFLFIVTMAGVILSGIFSVICL